MAHDRLHAAQSWRRAAARAAALWLLAFGAHAKAQPARQDVQRDIAYGADPAQRLDLYQASGPGPHRLAVWVHGGGWVAGDKRGAARLAGPLREAGYTVATVDYRLVPQTDLGGAMTDLAQATAFLLNHAAQFQINPAHFAVMGHSSGAHMAALLGTDQSYLRAAGVDPAKLAVVITLDGVYDIRANVTHYPTAQRREVFGTDPALWSKYSPIDHLAGMTAHPEFCVLHEDTQPRFIEQAALFEAALRAHGEHFQTAIAPGLKHGQLVGEFGDPAEPMAGFVEGCLQAALGK
jgi:acetyl esterase/lipase